MTFELCFGLLGLTVKLFQDLPHDVQLFDHVQLIFAEGWDLVLKSIKLPNLQLVLQGDFLKPALLKLIIVEDVPTE